MNKIKAGRHTAVVIDGEGCTDTLIFYLGQPAPLSIQKTIDSVKCNNTATGKLNIVASGGVGQYRYDTLNLVAEIYDWFFDKMRAGTYIVEIEDSNRCHIRDTSVIFQPTPSV